MTTTNGTGAKEGLAGRVSTAVAVADAPKAPTLAQMITRQRDQVALALPTHLKDNADAFVRAAITVCKQTPGLAKCDPLTIIGGLMTASQMGLELGPLQLAYLIPYGNQAQLQIGYRGYIELGYRSGMLRDITAEAVHDNDQFTFDRANGEISHTWDLRQDRGKAYAYYAIANLKDGGRAFVVLSRAEVEKFRQRSKQPNGPAWKNDFDAMGKKTAIRRLEPYMPKSSELSRAFNLDGAITRGSVASDLTVEVPDQNWDIDGEVVPDADDNGEIADAEVVGDDEPRTGPLTAADAKP